MGELIVAILFSSHKRDRGSFFGRRDGTLDSMCMWMEGGTYTSVGIKHIYCRPKVLGKTLCVCRETLYFCNTCISYCYNFFLIF